MLSESRWCSSQACWPLYSSQDNSSLHTAMPVRPQGPKKTRQICLIWLHLSKNVFGKYNTVEVEEPKYMSQCTLICMQEAGAT